MQQALLALGAPAQMEARTHDLLFSIDIVSEVKGMRVAVEVDGPDHYSRNALPAGQLGLPGQLVDWAPPGEPVAGAAAAAAAAAGDEEQQPLVLAPTLARRACLRSRGWQLATVPYFEWQRLAGPGERAAYLLRLLGPPAVQVGR